MNNFISKRKLEGLAALAFANSIQLHLDSIILFKERRYSSAFYLSVIAMEEMAKAKKLEHYYFYYTTKPDYKFEQQFLLDLYNHSSKQRAFIGRNLDVYSPKYYGFVESRTLDKKKLQALYVGLERIKDKINTKSRISRPTRIKSKDAKQQISVFNSELKHLISSMDQYHYQFSIAEMDSVLIAPTTREIASSWRYKSGLRSEKWWKGYWSKRFPSPQQ